MIRFDCDYSGGVHERILNKLMETNLEQTPGYREDPYCEGAATIIRKLYQKEGADVHFLVGDTQANATVITSALRSHQGVAGAVTAHISVHETGAVEATGHKILSLPSADGKVTASQVEGLYLAHINDESFEHMVQPGMVHISNPAELETIYTRAELGALYGVCRTWGLYLFVNGARLAYRLAAEGNDVDLKVPASNCDVFYIGGTKVDTLLGEAVVVTDEELREGFHYHIKQRGGILTKGRLLGIQFGELLRDGLHMELGRHGDRMTGEIRRACRDKEILFLMTNTTNQVFPTILGTLLEQWKDKYSYTNQSWVDETHTAIRLCTGWATGGEHMDALVKDILNS